LSRGLEEALLGYLARAKNKGFALHGAVYEFQKAELLEALAAADKRGAEVDFVYHHRKKGDKDTTAAKNDKAVKAAKIQDLCTKRAANPQNAIMHDKFVVLLEKAGKEYKPVAVWTGSTNWTDGGVYGQLNVGHAIFDEKLASTYEGCFQILKQDLDAEETKASIEKLTPVSQIIPPAPGITPVFSPQTTETMLHLYSSICSTARCVLVCAPFALSPVILTAFTAKPQEPVLRYFLLDKEGSLGPSAQEVSVIENDPSNAIGVAVTLSSPLHDFQGKLLEGKESFRHAGVHIHSKIILANPFGTDPILVMGSANFSHGSTELNDSNSLVLRGNTAVADIYATEFMRMFEHYHFRASQEHALKKVKKAAKKGTKSTAAARLALVEDDSWSEKYYVKDSHDELDRMMFAGTLH
jgi:phosphatidylserine/phosphatidylglycerophosphate/cardiolipin synthase-like enzyme